jgi:hypothetical protein
MKKHTLKFSKDPELAVFKGASLKQLAAFGVF